MVGSKSFHHAFAYQFDSSLRLCIDLSTDLFILCVYLAISLSPSVTYLLACTEACSFQLDLLSPLMALIVTAMIQLAITRIPRPPPEPALMKPYRCVRQQKTTPKKVIKNSGQTKSRQLLLVQPTPDAIRADDEEDNWQREGFEWTHRPTWDGWQKDGDQMIHKRSVGNV